MSFKSCIADWGTYPSWQEHACKAPPATDVQHAQMVISDSVGCGKTEDDTAQGAKGLHSGQAADMQCAQVGERNSVGVGSRKTTLCRGP